MVVLILGLAGGVAVGDFLTGADDSESAVVVAAFALAIGPWVPIVGEKVLPILGLGLHQDLVEVRADLETALLGFPVGFVQVGFHLLAWKADS